MGKFIDYFAELNEAKLQGVGKLILRLDARQTNLEIIEKIKIRLGNNPSKQAEYLQGLAREARPIFEDNKKYADYFKAYISYVIETKVKEALLDGEVSQKELSIIVQAARELGESDEKTIKTIKDLVEDAHGIIEDPRSDGGREFSTPSRSKFTDYFAELNGAKLAGISKLVPKLDARLTNLEIIGKMKIRLGNNPSKQAEYLQGLAREARLIFEDDKKYREYLIAYVGYVIETKVQWALGLDGKISQEELSIIIQSARDLGVSHEVALKTIKVLVKNAGGTIESPGSGGRREFGKPPPKTQPQPKAPPQPGAGQRQQSGAGAGSSTSGSGTTFGLDNLTPVEKANIATSIAGTLGLLYVLLKVTWVPLNWWGLLIPAIAAIISIKNANLPVKRHAWSLVAILFLYFWNAALLLVLLPTFLLWHWSPVIFAKLKLKPSYVWILPIVLCLGVYSTSYAVKRVPRRTSNMGFVQPAPKPPVQQQAPRQERNTQNRPAQTKPVPQSSSGQSQPTQTRRSQTTSPPTNTVKTTKPPTTSVPPKTQEPKPPATRTQPKSVTYVFNADSSAFELYSSEGIQGTGIVVNQGDSIIIDVSDKTTVVWSEGEDPVGPAGSSAIALSRNNGTEFLIPQSPCGAVIGRIGQAGKWFCIGQKYRAQADREGELFLTINDRPNGFADNFGFFGLSIIVKRRVPKTASLFAPDSKHVFAQDVEIYEIRGAI